MAKQNYKIGEFLMGNWLLLLRLSILVCTLPLFWGCASSFQSLPPEEMLFQRCAQTQIQDNLRVTAAVLSADEAEAVFGFALYKRGIQPIWHRDPPGQDLSLQIWI